VKPGCITDNHFHLDPEAGLGVEAAKRFERAGGTCLILVHKPVAGAPEALRSERGFQEAFERTLRLKKRVESETRLCVNAVIGVHPAELVQLSRRMGVNQALELCMHALDLAGRLVEEGSAIAIGEIGRPHFTVEKKLLQACNKLLEHGMAVAGDVGCALQVHAEACSEALCRELSRMAKRAGLREKKVVKHFCSSGMDVERRHGITLSILARGDAIKESLKVDKSFLMESDYMDDLSRPGAVLGPKAVPRVTRRLVEGGWLSLDEAERIHRDNVESLYGLELP